MKRKGLSCFGIRTAAPPFIREPSRTGALWASVAEPSSLGGNTGMAQRPSPSLQHFDSMALWVFRYYTCFAQNSAWNLFLYPFFPAVEFRWALYWGLVLGT